MTEGMKKVSVKKRVLPFAAAIATAAMALTACGGSTSGTDATQSAAAQAPSATAASVAAPDEIRIAYQAYAGSDVIVKNSGWLEAAFPNTTITWTKFDSGADINTAFIAGSIDIGLIGSAPTAAGLSQPLGIPYRVSWIFDVTGDAEALVARNDTGITDIAGLVGKKVGTPFGSTAHYSLLAALNEAGVSPDDVQLIDLQPQDILAAWQRGDIDAAYVWFPVLTDLQKDGTVLITSKTLAEQGYPTLDVSVITRAFSAAYPQVVQEYLRIQNQAVELIQKSPDEAGKIVGAELSLDPSIVLEQFKGLTFLNAQQQQGPQFIGTPDAPGQLADTLLGTAEFLKEQGKVEGVPTLDELHDDIDVQALFDAFEQ